MPRRPRIVVVGSSNTDMIVRAPRLPRPGETVLGGQFAQTPGGKGANQAVAAARLGAQVTFIARVGTDIFGASAVAGFDAEGIDTSHIIRDPDTPSGVALIGVDEATGENAISVAPGANARLSVADIEAARETIQNADMVICQLEIPLATVQAALTLACAARVPAILNPAPAQALPREMLALASFLTPNETEAALLSGLDNPADSAQALLKQGAGAVIVTLGGQGALLAATSGETQIIKGRAIAHVVDTTAAGDCFTAALGVALAEGEALPQAVAFCPCRRRPQRHAGWGAALPALARRGCAVHGGLTERQRRAGLPDGPAAKARHRPGRRHVKRKPGRNTAAFHAPPPHRFYAGRICDVRRHLPISITKAASIKPSYPSVTERHHVLPLHKGAHVSGSVIDNIPL